MILTPIEHHAAQVACRSVFADWCDARRPALVGRDPDYLALARLLNAAAARAVTVVRDGSDAA